MGRPRLDLGVAAVTLVAVSSFLPWLDVKWVSTGCGPHGGTNGGVLSLLGIASWLVGAALLVVAIARDRRDLLLLPALVATIVGIALLIGTSVGGRCGNGLLG